MTRYDEGSDFWLANRCPLYRRHWDQPGRCDGCGAALTGRRTVWCSAACEYEFRAQHMWSAARQRAVQRAGRRCSRDGCGQQEGLQVNHITPRAGRGYDFSCAHHADGLEVLCHPHHVEVTNTQRAAGLLSPEVPRA